MFNMAAYVTPDTQPDLQKSLKENVDATRHLVTKFVQLSGPNNFPPSRVEMYAKAQEAQTQVRWPSHTVHTISHKNFNISVQLFDPNWMSCARSYMILLLKGTPCVRLSSRPKVVQTGCKAKQSRQCKRKLFQKNKT